MTSWCNHFAIVIVWTIMTRIIINRNNNNNRIPVGIEGIRQTGKTRWSAIKCTFASSWLAYWSSTRPQLSMQVSNIQKTRGILKKIDGCDGDCGRCYFFFSIKKTHDLYKKKCCSPCPPYQWTVLSIHCYSTTDRDATKFPQYLHQLSILYELLHLET